MEVWVADVAGLGDAPARLLDAADRDRAARYRSEPARRLFAASRAMQRVLGGHYLGVPADRVAIGRRCALCGDDSHGRPYLVDGGGVDYSVSHSGTLVVAGYARDARVGVDLEADDRRTDHELLSGQVLAPAERDSLVGLTGDAARRAFLRLWTRKEAVLKLTGHGLVVPLADVTVLASPVAVSPVPGGWPAAPLWVSDLSIMDGYRGAIASTTADPAVVVHRAEPLLS